MFQVFKAQHNKKLVNITKRDYCVTVLLLYYYCSTTTLHRGNDDAKLYNTWSGYR